MRNPHPSLTRLNREWSDLAEETVPRSWRVEPALSDLPDLGAVLAAVRPAPDEVLAALLRIGEPAAHRVVLQALLGRLVLDAARDPRHDFDDYLAELWLLIAEYPLARRPNRIAANLVLDARKRVRAQRRERPTDPVRLGELARAAPIPAPNPALLFARARRVALINPGAERALRLVYSEGYASQEAAALLGVTPAALRQRCHRALRRLAARLADFEELVA